MFTIISLIFFMMVFGRLLGFAFRVGWSLLKISAYLILLPAIVLMLIFGGLVYVALPILLIVGLIGMTAKSC